MNIQFRRTSVSYPSITIIMPEALSTFKLEESASINLPSGDLALEDTGPWRDNIAPCKHKSFILSSGRGKAKDSAAFKKQNKKVVRNSGI